MKVTRKVKKNFHFFHNLSRMSSYESSQYPYRALWDQWWSHSLRDSLYHKFEWSNRSCRKKWCWKKYIPENSLMRNQRIYRKCGKYWSYKSRISRTDTFSRWDSECQRWASKCLLWDSHTRKSHKNRRKTTWGNMRIWGLHGGNRTIQAHRWIYLWEWDRTSCSRYRYRSSPRTDPRGSILRRADEDCSSKNSPIKAWFSSPRWADELHRPLKCRVAREILMRNLEMMIYTYFSWSCFSRWDSQRSHRNARRAMNHTI